jgi:hypothetical protein
MDKTRGNMILTTKGAAELAGMDQRSFLRAVKRTGTLDKHPASGKFRFRWSREALERWTRGEDARLPPRETPRKP